MLVEYLRPIASQFSIADTGSENYELDAPLIKSWGDVTLSQYEWNDDFAAARNHTLKFLDTEWVLHVDCDELPSLPMMNHIAEVTDPASQRNGVYGWRYFTINYWGGEKGASVPEHWHARLFKRGHGVWYKRLHEQVAINTMPEHQAINEGVLVNAPEWAYLIHSKPREQLLVSEALYARIGG